VLLSKDHLRAVVEKVLVVEPSDEELRQVAQQLREPVIVATSLFGPVTLDPQIGWFEGKAPWNGQMVKLYLQPDDDDISGAIRTSESLWNEQATWTQRVDNFAVEKLLPLKNDSWLGDDEREFTPQEFKKRMTLQSITVNGDGSFDFWHDDGDLFWGHSIEIRGTLEEGPVNADIAG
jgi:hypothetical protein